MSKRRRDGSFVDDSSVASIWNAVKDSNGSPKQPANEPAKSTSDTHQQSADNDGWQVAESKGTRKKRRKLEQAQQNQVANVNENDNEAAYPSVSFPPTVHLQSVVKIEDLQQLMFYLVGDGHAPNWVTVQSRQAVDKVVVLVSRDRFVTF